MVGDKNIGDIGGSKLPGVRRIDIGKQAPETKPTETPKTDKQKETSRENRAHYSKPTDSQNTLAANKTGSGSKIDRNRGEKMAQEGLARDQNLTETGLKKDYEIKNVSVEAFLKTRKPKKRPRTEKSEKNAPPRPSLKTRLSPKGPIRPRQMPAIPGRLKGLSPADPKKQLEEAVNFIESQPAYQDPNLIAQYAKRLLAKGIDTSRPEMASLAKILGLDESIADLDRDSIIKTISEKMNSSDISDDLQAMLADVLALLAEPETHQLKPLVILFLPFPFPYMLQELDDEFWDDDGELFEEEAVDEESDEEDEDSEDESEEYDPDKRDGKSSEKQSSKAFAADADDEENFDNSVSNQGNRENIFNKNFKPDVEASMSINTLNYGKLHLNISHDSINDKFKLRIKGDEVAGDLTNVLESSLDLAMGEGSEILQRELKSWHDNVLRITESRALKIDSSGKMNERFLKACNVILKTICDQDPEKGSPDIEAEYKII